MNSLIDDPEDDVLVPPSKLSIYKRIANLSLAIVALVVTMNLWLSSSEKEQAILQQQANQMGKTLLHHTANIVALELQEDNLSGIDLIIKQLADDPHVHSAALYDPKGQVLLHTEHHSSLPTLYRQAMADDLLVYVENIYMEEKLTGYLRLLLNKEKVLENQALYQQNSRQQIQLMLFLALLAGFWLSRGFYKLKYRSLLAKLQRQRKITD